MPAFSINDCCRKSCGEDRSYSSGDDKAAGLYGRSVRCLFVDFCDNAVEGIYQSTPDGRYLFVNPALARMYGYDSPDDLLASVNDIQSDIYADPSLRDTFRREMETGGVVAGLEYQVRRRDGSLLWICEHARAVKDSEGVVLRYEGSVHDISPRKLAEEEHRRLEAQLRQAHKMEAIGTLAGGIAHDFNNILAVIQGFTQLALEDNTLPARSRGFLDESLKATHRAADIVKQILSFSRKTETERVCLKLRTIVREITSLIRSGLPSNIELRSEFNVQEDWVQANPTQMHQVLLNLCTNAGHAMRQGGGVLSVSVDRFSGVLPAGLENQEYLALIVSDTGTGIDPAILDRIFDPFFTTKPKGEGTGLGLSVALGIMQSHGGTILVESILGRGTSFKVLLPSSEACSFTPKAIHGEVPCSFARILCVDDEDGILAMLQHHLSRRGYRVSTRSNGTEALRCFQREPSGFDIVLTDYTMPGMQGTELCREIRKIRDDIPVLLCSGNLDRLSVGELGKIGVHAIVSKPINFPALYTAIEAALRA